MIDGSGIDFHHRAGNNKYYIQDMRWYQSKIHRSVAVGSLELELLAVPEGAMLQVLIARPGGASSIVLTLDA